MQSGRTIDKFVGFTDIARSENGLYYLSFHINAFLSAKVVNHKDLGSHTLFIAELTNGEFLSSVLPVLTAAIREPSILSPRPQPRRAGYAAESGRHPRHRT